MTSGPDGGARSSTSGKSHQLLTDSRTNCPTGTSRGTIGCMATNLRLQSDTEDALRAEARRSGRSQQDIIREALNRYLNLAPIGVPATELDALVATGHVRPPRTPFKKARQRISLPGGVTSKELLDRTDRF